MALLPNNDNDDIPIIHIRFSVLDYDSAVLIEFMNSYIDEFKIKGIVDINGIVTDKAQHIKTINYDKAKKGSAERLKTSAAFKLIEAESKELKSKKDDTKDDTEDKNK